MGLIVIGAAFIASVAMAPRAASQSEDERQPSGGLAASVRMREGAALNDQAGAFQLAGDRVVFVFEATGREMTVLENLALERVARVVRQSASPLTWVVTGVVTEYQGNNFLLLQRAVIRRAADSNSSPH